MRGAAASARILLTRPSVLLPALAATAVFSVMAVVLTFVAASQPGGSRVTRVPLVLADLARPDGLATLVGRPVMVTGVVVLGVSAAHVGGQYGSGFVRAALTRDPGRLRWLWGTWAVLVAGACLLAVLAAAVSAAAALVCAAAFGVPVVAWATGEGLAGAAGTTLGLACGLSAFAVAGSALAVWLRGAAAAVVVGLVYALFENVAVAVGPLGTGLLPLSAFTTVATAGSNGGPLPQAALATALFVAVITAAVSSLLRDRDVLD